LYEKETADAQAKLEAEALKKYEEEKKAEEAKMEAAAAADPKAKKAPPPKGKGKGDDKPNLDVPTLPVPEILPFESKMGKKFLFERSVDDISIKLMTPAPTEEEINQQDADNAQEPSIVDQRETPDPSAAGGSKADLKGKESKEGVADGEEEE
jgi:hypothetical protein